MRGELRPGGTAARVVRPRGPAPAAAGVAWPRCGPRSSPPTSARSPASRRPGRASTATRRAARASTGCARCSCRCRALPLPLEVWERDVLPRRTGAYSPAWMDQLCASGEIVWVGAGALGRRSGRVALYFRDDAPLIGPPPKAGEPPAEPVHEAVRERLQAGPCFFTDLLTDVAGFTTEELQNAALGPRVGRRGDQRRVRAAALAEADRDAVVVAARARRAPAHVRHSPPRRRPARGPGPLVADGRAVRQRRRSGPRAAAPRPSCCSSATGSSPASRCWPRASRAGSHRSMTRWRRWRRSGSPAAATSSKASAAPSSRCPAPSSGCARRRTTTPPRRSCSPRPIPPSRTAPC